MKAAEGYELALVLVQLRGQQRVHYVAQIREKAASWGTSVRWEAPTTVCGRTGWRGVVGRELRFCGKCHAGVQRAWDAAPAEFKARDVAEAVTD